MEIAALLNENIFNIVGAVGVIGSLWFTAVSLRSETRTRRNANLLTITANNAKIPMFMPRAIEESDLPKQAAQANTGRDWQSSNMTATKKERTLKRFRFIGN